MILNKRKITCLYEIIHFSMHFQLYCTYLLWKHINYIFTNDLKRIFFFEKMLKVTDLVSLNCDKKVFSLKVEIGLFALVFN